MGFTLWVAVMLAVVFWCRNALVGIMKAILSGFAQTGLADLSFLTLYIPYGEKFLRDKFFTDWPQAKISRKNFCGSTITKHKAG